MTRSSDRIKEQVQETVRDLPVQAARLALFGVGRTLLLTDRVRKDYKEAREAGLRPVLDRWRHDAEELAGKVVGKVTERVSRSESQPAPAERPETPETPVARPPARKTAGTAPAGTAPADKAAPQPDRVTKAAPAPTPQPDRVTKAAADSLPVPDYDTATLASVRARLRSLSAVQVSQLRDYEQATAARADFLRMFDNRIAKLTSDS
jgi:hypothetical protein